MNEAVEAAAPASSRAWGEFVEQAHAYVDLLREHIQKEDHCLFGMANQAFSGKTSKKLLAAFHPSKPSRSAPAFTINTSTLPTNWPSVRACRMQ